MTAPIVRTLAELRAFTTAWHKADEVIGADDPSGSSDY